MPLPVRLLPLALLAGGAILLVSLAGSAPPGDRPAAGPQRPAEAEEASFLGAPPREGDLPGDRAPGPGGEPDAAPYPPPPPPWLTDVGEAFVRAGRQDRRLLLYVDPGFPT